MSVGSVAFACMALTVKLLSGTLPVQELVFWRAGLSLPVLIVLVLYRRRPFVAKNRAALLRRSIFGFGAMVLYFLAVFELTLAEASMLMKLQPVWVAVLSPVLVQDKASPRVFVALGFGLAGVGLLLGPSISQGVLGIAGLAGLVSSLLAALAHLELRRLGRTDHPDVVVLGFTFLLLVFSGIATAPVAVWPSSGSWPLLATVALCAMVGQFFMTSAYRAAPAPLVATVGYLTLPIAVFFDWALFGYLPTVWGIGGGALIVVAGFILTVAPKKRSATDEQPGAPPSDRGSRSSDSPQPR